MRNLSPELFDWLHNHRDIDKWALSKFSFRRWDNIKKNIAKSFNTWMVNKKGHNIAQFIHEPRENCCKEDVCIKYRNE